MEQNFILLAEPPQGHTTWAHSVLYSPNGGPVTSGSHDCTVRLWNACSSNVTFGTWEGRTMANYANPVSFSPGTTRVSSGSYGSYDQTIQIWCAKGTMRLLDSLQLNLGSGVITPVKYSPDGAFVASDSAEAVNVIRLWSSHHGPPTTFPRAHIRTVISATPTPCPYDNIVVNGSYDKTVRTWDVSDSLFGTGTSQFEGHQDWISSVAFSPEGILVASGTDDCTVLMRRIGEDTPVTKPTASHHNLVQPAGYSCVPDDLQIVPGTKGWIIQLWDTEWDLTSSPPSESGLHSITATSFSAASVCDPLKADQNSIHIWDPLEGRLKMESADKAQLRSGTFSFLTYTYCRKHDYRTVGQKIRGARSDCLRPL
ncbi:hypothetical protein RSOLAG1IB_10686 [Rhizoctonia solani AG-1 IB]|uniref:Uncharacterized protein n=1 Tax=Thanatephorus cucumeris (strain AG1-IB / isolate 7/3/14) TaxID=1108050 RepID=A0A0B7G3P3_THACB|nr:hypothetical protein RSOLAG1IB_10686 [Rhizoctonia solani AG-1 IB]